MYADWPCNVWAKQGECEVNPKFMKVSCKKACGVCGGDSDDSKGTTYFILQLKNMIIIRCILLLSLICNVYIICSSKSHQVVVTSHFEHVSPSKS